MHTQPAGHTSANTAMIALKNAKISHIISLYLDFCIGLDTVFQFLLLLNRFLGEDTSVWCDHIVFCDVMSVALFMGK